MKIKSLGFALALASGLVLNAADQPPVPAGVADLVAQYKQLRATFQTTGTPRSASAQSSLGTAATPTSATDRVELMLQQRATLRKMGQLRQAIKKSLGMDDGTARKEPPDQAAKATDPQTRRDLFERHSALRAVTAAQNNARIEELLK